MEGERCHGEGHERPVASVRTAGGGEPFRLPGLMEAQQERAL